MNKVLVSSAFAVANLLAVAAFSNSTFDGFYVGASAGYSSLDAKEKIGIENPGGTGRNSSPRTKSNNLAGSIHAGYGWSFENRGYLGSELSVNFASHKTKYNLSDGDRNGSRLEDSISKKWTAGVNIMPGVYLKEDVLALLKVGANVSRFKYEATDNYFDRAGPDETSLLSTSKSQVLAGFNLGAAVKISMSDSLSLRFEVDHTIYRKFKAEKIKSEEHQLSTKIDPTATTFMVGFSYKI